MYTFPAVGVSVKVTCLRTTVSVGEGALGEHGGLWITMHCYDKAIFYIFLKGNELQEGLSPFVTGNHFRLSRCAFRNSIRVFCLVWFKFLSVVNVKFYFIRRTCYKSQQDPESNK